MNKYKPKLTSKPIDPELELIAGRRRLEIAQRRLYRWTKATTRPGSKKGRRSELPPRHIIEG